MYVEEAIDKFFDNLKTDLYHKGLYDEADKALELRDSLNQYIANHCVGLSPGGDTEIWNDGHMHGYGDAKNEAEALVRGYMHDMKSVAASVEEKVDSIGGRLLKNIYYL